MRRLGRIGSLMVAVCGTAIGAAAAHGAVWYVDDSATGGGDGASWATAFGGLQAALDVAQAGDEIRVAQGRYTPAGVGGSRDERFLILREFAVRGGYAGVGAADPDARDIVQHETVLSGDLNGDDGAGFANTSDNSANVVVLAFVGPGMVLDGVTVSGGNADDPTNRTGAGMHSSQASPTVVDCTFENNRASGDFSAGGAVACRGSGTSPTFTRCTFVGNAVETPTSNGGTGGGLYAEGSLTLDGCVFGGNGARRGGAVYVSRDFTATGCAFTGNTATQGGGIFRTGNQITAFTVTDSEFSGNSAHDGGGINFSNSLPTPVLERCVFTGNTASGLDSFGGGVFGFGGSGRMERCVFTGNSAGTAGGAITTAGEDSAIVNCTITGNSAGFEGAGVELTASDSVPVLRNCILWENTVNGNADEAAQIAVFFDGQGQPTLHYCDVQGLLGTYAGTGNFSADPLFAAPENGDFSLLAGSPCIDAGDPDPAFNDPNGTRNDVGAVVANNIIPVAAATVQQLTSIGASAMVRLDASGSSDADDARSTLAVEWFVDGVPACSGTFASCGTIDVPMSYGSHTVLLRVTDPKGASDEDVDTIEIDSAALSLLAEQDVTVNFRAGTVRYSGQVGLPSGVDFTEVARQVRVRLEVADQTVVAPVVATFNQNPLQPSEWTLATGAGLTRFDIDWGGSRFVYREQGVPVVLKSTLITSSQTVLNMNYRRRAAGGAFSVDIGGLATVNVNAAGTASANVPFTVEDPGREITLTLPFPITDATVITFSGAVTGVVDAGDYLTFSTGRFLLEAPLNTAAFPAGSATTPRKIDLFMRVGAEEYSGAAVLGPTDLSVVREKWRSN